MIVAAAIKISPALYCVMPPPFRHIDILTKMAKEGVRRDGPINDGRKGFITDTGQFLHRVPALQHARECGQKFKSLTQNENLGLFTEDLW